MSQEQLIAEAILQLKNEPNIFKDYLFPIAIAFFSASIGGLVGYSIYLRQEKVALEKYKLDMANKWLVMSYQIFQQLIGFKTTYNHRINQNPIERVLTLPTILREDRKYSFDYYELAFIAIGNESSKYNLGNLPTIFDNYINLLVILKKRDELNENFKKNLFQKMDIEISEISENFILKNTHQKDLSALIDLTEIFLQLTDELIIELYNFLEIFPNEARKKIKLKNLENYGGILNFNLKANSKINNFLIKVPNPDYKKISQISGKSLEETMARYKPLFNSKE